MASHTSLPQYVDARYVDNANGAHDGPKGEDVIANENLNAGEDRQ